MRPLAWVLLAVVSACSEIPHSQVNLVLVTEPASYGDGTEGPAVDDFRVRLWGGRYQTEVMGFGAPSDPPVSLPVELAVFPIDDDATREFTAVAELFADGRSLGVQRAIGNFVQNELRVHTLVFRRVCETATCGSDERCNETGACEAACFEHVDGGTAPVECGPSAGLCEVCDGMGCTPRPASDACFDGISLGAEHGCASSAGQLFCWGTNRSGQLGLGDTERRTAPTPISSPGGARWTSFDTGGDATCATIDSDLYCWGTVPANGATVNDLTPTPVRFTPTSGWTDFSVTTDWFCGIYPGNVKCLGAGPPRLMPSDNSISARSIDTSLNVVCALDDSGGRRCWGNNNNGQLGQGGFVGFSQFPDEDADESTEYRKLVVSNGHSCGLTSADTIFCWGLNTDGQLGDPAVNDPFDRCSTDTTCSADPVLVPMSGWTDIAVGDAHSCGIRQNELYCWGSNSHGQLGLDQPTTATDVMPARVTDPTSGTWSAVTASAAQTCALTSDGALYCWGNNEGGRLGFTPVGSPAIMPIPQRIFR